MAKPPGNLGLEQADGVKNVAEAITMLKQQPGKTIGVHSSLTLVRSLLDLGLLDELVLTVFPVLAGKGRHLLTSEDSFHQLKLVSSQSTRTGGHNLIYQLIPR